MEAGSKLKSVWIRVLDFLRKLWSTEEFEKLIDGFGILYEQDIQTLERISLKEAKIRTGVCNYENIPPFEDVMFRNEYNEMNWHRYQERGSKKRKIWVRKSGKRSEEEDKGASSSKRHREEETGGNVKDLIEEEYDDWKERDADEKIEAEKVLSITGPASKDFNNTVKDETSTLIKVERISFDTSMASKPQDYDNTGLDVTSMVIYQVKSGEKSESSKEDNMVRRVRRFHCLPRKRS